MIEIEAHFRFLRIEKEELKLVLSIFRTIVVLMLKYVSN